MARVRGLSTYGTVCSAVPSDTSISVWPYELTGNGACQRFCPTRRYSALMDPRAFRYRRVGSPLGRWCVALVILCRYVRMVLLMLVMILALLCMVIYEATE